MLLVEDEEKEVDVMVGSVAVKGEVVSSEWLKSE